MASKTLVLFLVIVSNYGTYEEPFPWHEYPEVHGLSFCSTRPVDEGTCCPGRNDTCSVPMLDTVCYCDMFCDRTRPDCCPDFINSCMGGGRTIEAHKAAQLKYAGSKLIDNNCFHEGIKYTPGDQIKFNCNNCTCVYAVVSEEYNWECSQKICLVRTSVLHRVNEGAYGWRAKNYSFLWGESLNDGASYKLGTERPHITSTQIPELKVKEDDVIPAKFDARSKWPGFISGIKDQGNCAASWAFSATSVASDRLAIHSGGEQKVALSPQQMVSCNTQGQKGCQGGHVDRAWWFLRTNGLVSDECYPYRSGSSGEKETCIIPKYRTRQTKVRCASKTQEWSKVYKVAPPYRVPPIEKEIMKEIMEYGPVQATLEVQEDFYLYSGGVYQNSMPANMLPPNRRKSGYHSVRIIGWGIDHSGQIPLKYWLCANSWGTDWGENGYFRIVRGVNEGEIESFVLAVSASVRNSRAASPANGLERSKRTTSATRQFLKELEILTTETMDALNIKDRMSADGIPNPADGHSQEHLSDEHGSGAVKDVHHEDGDIKSYIAPMKYNAINIKDKPQDTSTDQSFKTTMQFVNRTSANSKSSSTDSNFSNSNPTSSTTRKSSFSDSASLNYSEKVITESNNVIKDKTLQDIPVTESEKTGENNKLPNGIITPRTNQSFMDKSNTLPYTRVRTKKPL